MRRTLFYLSVALLAFGIGSFAVFKFYWKGLPKPVAENIEVEIKLTEQNAVDKTSSTKFVCEDEAINTVWKTLMQNKVFLNDAYVNVVQSGQIKDCRILFDVKPIQLNNGENEAFLIISQYFLFCGSGNDCQTWIVAKIHNQYKIILTSVAGNSTTDVYPHSEVEILETETHGFKDLKVFIANGWDADNFGYYKFDGNRYKLKKCLRDFNSAYVYSNDYTEKWLPVKSRECLIRKWF